MNNQKIEKIVSEVIDKSLGHNKEEIDLKEICSKYNINIVEEDLDDEISGMLLFKNDKNFIVINSLQSPLRQRFTIAHELGHFFLHDKNSLYLDKKVFFRNNDSKEGNFKIEIEANNFAANLLMPKKRIENFIINYKHFDPHNEEHLKAIAKKFEVSQIAITYRLINLNIL